MITPGEMIDRLNAIYGTHAGRRTLHAKGIICSGTFRPTPEAAEMTRAAHMNAGDVPVLARLSNGSGNPHHPDRAPDVRGLAVSFELPDGSRTDILAQTAPRFPVKTPDEFIQLVEAVHRSPRMIYRLPIFLLRNPGAIPSLRVNLAALGPPDSYASATFYAIHAFRWVDAGGGERWVRYTWIPRSEASSGALERSERGRDFLIDEVRARLPDEPIRFDLELQVAEAGDDPHDPRSRWPDQRRRVIAGALELTGIDDAADSMIFDPMRLTAGVEPSEDPILNYRPKAYSVSFERRNDGAP
jgi:catalase